jgi:hypothetical protein
MSIKFSIDLKSFGKMIAETFKVNNLKRLFKNSYEGFWIYLVYFIVSEIIISGGRFEKDIYLEIVELIIVLSLSAYFLMRKPPATDTDAVRRGFMNLVVFVLLDFLAINLLLDQNSGMVYKYWGTLANYALVLAMPYLFYQIKSGRFFARKTA